MKIDNEDKDLDAWDNAVLRRRLRQSCPQPKSSPAKKCSGLRLCLKDQPQQLDAAKTR
jgi:hypothetical protein